MYAIGSTVEHLDALDVSCGPTFCLLGRKHLQFIDNFMSAGYLDAFVESVAKVFEQVLPCDDSDDHLTAEVYDAWRNVFTFVVDRMCEGYEQALEEAERNAQLRDVSD